MRVQSAKWLISFFLVLAMHTVSTSQSQDIVVINEDDEWGKSSISFTNVGSNAFFLRKDEVVSLYAQDDRGNLLHIPTKEPILLLFSRNFKFQLVYVFPGDTLKFKPGQDNDSLLFRLKGNRSECELMFYPNLEAAGMGLLKLDMRLVELTRSLNYQYVADSALDLYHQRIGFLKEQMKTCTFSKQGKETIERNFYYQYLTHTLFPYSRAAQSDFDNAVIPESYKDFLRKYAAEFGNDSLLSLRDYRGFSFLYARFLALEASGRKCMDEESLLMFYKESFSGRLRDFLLFDECYMSYLSSRSTSNIDLAINSIEDLTRRDTLISIKKRTVGNFSDDALKTMLQPVDGEPIALSDFLSSFESSPLYIDFWATWCGPCLIEMPASHELKDELQDKDIKFVYFSIDDDEKKWRNKLTSLPAGDNVHHFRVVSGQDFMKYMGNPEIPRYVFLGRNSKMVSFYAPRPRTKAIRNLIAVEVERGGK